MELADHFRFFRWLRAQDGMIADRMLNRFRIMGSDDGPGERYVGEIFSIGVGGSVGRVRRSAQCERVTADERRREPGR